MKECAQDSKKSAASPCSVTAPGPVSLMLLNTCLDRTEPLPPTLLLLHYLKDLAM